MESSGITVAAQHSSAFSIISVFLDYLWLPDFLCHRFCSAFSSSSLHYRLSCLLIDWQSIRGQKLFAKNLYVFADMPNTSLFCIKPESFLSPILQWFGQLWQSTLKWQQHANMLTCEWMLNILLLLTLFVYLFFAFNIWRDKNGFDIKRLP